eukprot:366465-Chlamydomonas_euryale.AAC.11
MGMCCQTARQNRTVRAMRRPHAAPCSSERSETYATPPVDTLRASGLSAVNVDLEADSEGGAAAALKEIEDAVSAKEKVARGGEVGEGGWNGRVESAAWPTGMQGR